MSRVKGLPAIRGLLRRLPDAAAQQMIVELHVTGRDMVPEMQARAPFKTGATRGGLSYRVLPKQLRLLVGLISTPLGRAKLFYARIQDLGRKAQTVTITRGPRAGATMNVPAMPGKHFITGRYPELRRRVGNNLRGIWDGALRRAATGGGEQDL